ncbi:MAG: hypothetical protein IK058_03160, partial [Bacteroidales bacterium]|nr:hypothetical protein [Bacteroidales bacterium]
MKYIRCLILTILLFSCGTVMAQDKARMAAHQQRLTKLFERVASAPTDNERYLSSEEAVDALRDALDEQGSERWRWQLPRSVSVLTSPDGRLRLFTWAVVRDNGEFECFGAVQYYNERTEAYEHEVLHDKSEDIMNREESL